MGIERKLTRTSFFGDQEVAKTLIPQGMQVLHILREQIRLSPVELNQLSVERKFFNGVVISAVSSFGQEQINIFVPPAGERGPEPLTQIKSQDFYGFICNPRIPGQNAGWVKGAPIPPNASVYPLHVLDHSNAAIIKTKEEYSQNKTPQLYGNIDWVGVNTNTNGGHNEPVLAWKGPPGRTTPFNYREAIPGLTQPDISFSGDDFFTCFGPDIYSGGLLFNTLPVVGDVAPKVLGCALQGKYLVAVVNNHYASISGFFEEIWYSAGGVKELYNPETNVNGWRKIYSTPAGRPAQCWFFNKSGTKATQGQKEYSVDIVNNTVSLYVYPTSTGSMIVSHGSTSRSIAHSGEWEVWSDYKGDTRVTALVRVSGGDTTTSTITESGQAGNVPLYYPGDGGISDIVVTGPEGCTVGAGYSFTGGTGSGCPQTVSWSMSGGTINGSGVVTSISGCGMGSVTATLGPSGKTNTLAVRLPSGIWVTTYSFHAQFGDTHVGTGSCGTGYFDCQGIIQNCYPCEIAVDISGAYKITTTYSNFARTGINECAFSSCHDPCYTLVRILPIGPFAKSVICKDHSDATTEFGPIENIVQEWRCP